MRSKRLKKLLALTACLAVLVQGGMVVSASVETDIPAAAEVKADMDEVVAESEMESKTESETEETVDTVTESEAEEVANVTAVTMAREVTADILSVEDAKNPVDNQSVARETQTVDTPTPRGFYDKDGNTIDEANNGDTIYIVRNDEDAEIRDRLLKFYYGKLLAAEDYPTWYIADEGYILEWEITIPDNVYVVEGVPYGCTFDDLSGSNIYLTINGITKITKNVAPSFRDADGNVITEAKTGDTVYFVHRLGIKYFAFSYKENGKEFIGNPGEYIFGVEWWPPVYLGDRSNISEWTIPTSIDTPQVITFFNGDNHNEPVEGIALTVSGAPTKPAEPVENPTPSSTPDSGNPNTASGTSGQQAAVQEAPSVNNVVAFSGNKTVTSAVGGVYIVKAVNGAAITTPANEVKASVGVTNPDTRVATYFCDSRNTKVNEALKNIAGEQKKTVAALFNADMYSISKEGKVEAIRESTTPVKMVFGIPKAAQGKTVSILTRDKAGKAVVFADTDTDPNTITVDANVFGIYALVY